MSGCRTFFRLPFALMLAAHMLNPIATAADTNAKKEGGKVAGILIDKQDNWISVKADGDDEAVKYVTGDASNRKLTEALKSLFTVSRVELTYRTDGESRNVVSIKRQVPKSSGTVTGEVVGHHGWWIEVKPTKGVSDGYACNFPFDQNKEMMEKLEELEDGDSVTITFNTDSERHRIQTLRKNPTAARKGETQQKPESTSGTGNEASKANGKIAGILIDKQNDWITVKADGEDEPVKYLVDVSDEKLREPFKAVFNACRVQLTFKTDGDARRLVGIKRQIFKTSGTTTGEVVKVHNDFWIEVKPRSGVADAYAPGADNYNDKEFMEKLKGLKPGDSVTITFTTDFERHRITTLRKNPPSQTKPGGSSAGGTPTKK